jgi:subtilisin-like proprotein convertase family protein
MRRLTLTALTICACLAAGVSSASAASYTTTSFGPGVTIVDDAAATPYPSELDAIAQPRVITDVNVKITNLDHTFPGDINLLLVSPSGTNVLLMSDICGGGDVLNVNLTFDDSAADNLSSGPCVSGTYKPTQVTPQDLPAPAPAQPYGTTLSLFNGENPNGRWRLYALDDSSPDSGLFDDWSLTITTEARYAIGDGTTPDAYPISLAKSGLTGPITDLNVSIDGLWTEFLSDLDIMLVGPGGQSVVLMSDACGSDDAHGMDLLFDDQSPVSFPATAGSGCHTRRVKPVDHGPPDTWAPPAPAAATGTTLAQFNGTDPNGDWKIFASDFFLSDPSAIEEGVDVELTLGPPETTIASVSVKKNKATAKIAGFPSAVSRFECKLDRGRYQECSKTFRTGKLKAGKHTIRARAIGSGGIDATPAVKSFKVKKAKKRR